MPPGDGDDARIADTVDSLVPRFRHAAKANVADLFANAVAPGRGAFQPAVAGV